MSKIAISGAATGTATFTIESPATSTNRTITIPDATTTLVGTDATQTLTNKTLTSPTLTTPNIDSAQFATVSGTAPLYACRAWVNFNGTGTVAIREDGNVSSITDNGTGSYSLNFATAMPDVNYSFSSGYGDPSISGTCLIRAGASVFLTTSLTIDTVSTTAPQDVAVVNIAIFR
jgi:hypothetical protein